LHEVTAELESLVREFVRETGHDEGLCTVFVRHTSARTTAGSASSGSPSQLRERAPSATLMRPAVG